MAKKILLIEDDKPTIDLYKEIFSGENFDLEIIETGAKSIEWLKEIKDGIKQKPDLVLLDIILPDINGFSILKEIKKSPETKNLKVAILTNYTNPEFNKEIEKLNAPILIKTSTTPNQLLEFSKKFLKE